MNEPIIVKVFSCVFGLGIYILFAAGFFYFGPWALVDYLRKINRCRHLVKGTVTDVKHVYDKLLDNPDSFNADSGMAWKPAICYTYNGNDYKAESSVVTSWKRHQAGQEVEIYINEKHPEEYYIRGEDTTLMIGFMFATLVFLVSSALAVGFLWKQLA